MKILSKEEFEKELENIVTYGDDIAIGKEDLHCGTKNDLIIMDSCEYCGANSSVEVIKSIILDFEKSGFFIKNADSILIYFQVNTNYKIVNLADAINIIHEECESISIKEPSVIWGFSCDDTLEDDYAKATIFISFSQVTQ